MIKVNRLTRDITVPGSTWLQGIGHVYGKPAIEFKVGDKMVWNGGSVTVVKRKLKETKTTVTFEIESFDTFDQGKLYERTFKKDRIVAEDK